MGKVLVSTSSFGVYDGQPLLSLKGAGCEVITNPYRRKLTKEEVAGLLPGCVGLIAGLETLDRDVLEKSDLKVISRCGTGMDNIDLTAASELGIVVRNTPDAPTEAVAELTIGCMINLMRHINQMDRDLHAKQWTKHTGSLLKGKTVVIIGFGRIGRRVAALLEAFQTKIITVDPYASEGEPKYLNLRLDEALSVADIITLHCDDKEPVLTDERIKKIKKGAVILNGSRGHLVDEDALVQALDSGQICGVWMDAYSREPYDGPLTQYSQALLTPHIGSYTKETRKQMEMEAVENLLRSLASLQVNAGKRPK